MNNMEMIKKVSEKSGVSTEGCQMVLKALEDVLSEELTNSKDVGKAFDKIYKLLSFFHKKNS